MSKIFRKYSIIVSIIIEMPLLLLGQTTIIPPIYDNARGFSEGLAAVCKDNKWGYINLRGDEVIAPQYKEVGDFSEDLAAVLIDDRWGFIDRNNNIVIKAKYFAAKEFSSGLAPVAIAKASYFGAKQDSWIYIDRNGNMPFKSQFLQAFPYNDGYAFVSFDLFGKESYYIDNKGVKQCTADDIPFRYSNKVIPKIDPNTLSVGYCDINGRWVLEPQYSGASEFVDGLAVVEKFAEGKVVINTNGETMFSGQNPVVLPGGYIYDIEKLYKKPNYSTPCFMGKVDCSFCYYPEYVIQANLSNYNPLFEEHKSPKILEIFTPCDGVFGTLFTKSKYGFVTFNLREYIDAYTSRQMTDWLKRGEFENSTDYERRTSEVNRRQKMVSLADELINNWLEKGLDEWSLSDYDADKECFELSTDLGKYLIKIPANRAKSLKSSWPVAKKQVSFKYENELCLASIDFTIPSGGKELTLHVDTSSGTIDENHNDNINKDLPSIQWIDFAAATKLNECPIKLGIKSSSKIEDIVISVNGTQDRSIKTVVSNDYDFTVNRKISLKEGQNRIVVSVTNAAGTVQDEKTIVYRPQGGELPSIEWLDFAATSNKKEYTIKLGIKSKSKVEEVNVTINGTLTRGIKTVTADGYDLTVDRTLSLSEGLNRILVSVRNGDGISTSEKVITYQGHKPSPVFNEKRIAFVIGNSHYSNPEMNLLNPENDAQDVAMKLKTLGFEVTLKLDATLETMDKELSEFKDKAKDYDVAIFYYAGHGIQSKGVNYIIPTNIDNLAEDNMKYKCVNMEHVLDVMEDSHCKLKIVILDACRNDPLSRRWHRSAGTRGLSMMNAPTGTIISYSTGAGKTAQDGKGRNSPYTEAFLNTLDVPNLDVFHFFQKVGAEVKRKTGQAQDPWWSSSFTGDFFFNKQ